MTDKDPKSLSSLLFVNAGLEGLAAKEAGDAVERVADFGQEEEIVHVAFAVLKAHEQARLCVAAAGDLLRGVGLKQVVDLLDDGGVEAAFFYT